MNKKNKRTSSLSPKSVGSATYKFPRNLSFRQPSSFKKTKEFKVVFHEKQIGLELGEDKKIKGQIIVENVRPGTEADMVSLPKLLPGLILLSVDNKLVESIGTASTLKILSNSRRPITLGFRSRLLQKCRSENQYNTRSDFEDEKGHIVLPVCIDFSITDYLTPTDEKQTGAKVNQNFTLDVSKFGKTLVLEEGWLLEKVGGVQVSSKSFKEIVNLISTPADEGLYQVLVFRDPTYKMKIDKSIFSFRKKSKRKIKFSQTEVEYVTPLPPSECLDSYADIVVSGANLKWSMDHVEKLFANERIISAGNMVHKIDGFLNCCERNDEVNSLAASWMEEDTKMRNKLITDRRDLGVESVYDFMQDEDAGWTFAQDAFGVKTYYKPEDNGTIWVKLAGKCEDVNVLDCLAVFREVDLYNLWAPFCNKAELLKYVSRVELVAYISVAIPLMTRDAVVHAYAIDASKEFGCVLILGDSVDTFDGVEAPTAKGWNSDRMIIRGFRCMLRPISRTAAFVTVVANIEPKCPLPQSLINFSTKKLAGMLLYFLLKEADKIAKDPESNKYAVRMREDPRGFYSWMTPRMQHYFTMLEEDKLPIQLCAISEKAIRNKNNQPGSETKIHPKRNFQGAISPIANAEEVTFLRRFDRTIHPGLISQSHFDRIFNFRAWPLAFPIIILILPVSFPFWVAGLLKLGISLMTWWFGIRRMCLVEERNNTNNSTPVSLRNSGLKFIIFGCLGSTALIWTLVDQEAAPTALCISPRISWLVSLSFAFSSAITGLLLLNQG